MAKVFIEETTLTAIGDAIRGKTGKTDLIDPANMSTEIAGIEAGGGAEIPDIVLTGNAAYACAGAIATAFIEKYPTKVTTKNLANVANMFNGSTLTHIPFDINISIECDTNQMFYQCTNLVTSPALDLKHTTYHSAEYMFYSCTKLENVAPILNMYPSSISNLFNNCDYLRALPDDFFDSWNFSRLLTYNYASLTGVFNGCTSLRRFPSSFFDKLSSGWLVNSIYSQPYYNMAMGCYTLDEITNIPVPAESVTFTSNAFYSTVDFACRLKRFTFAMNEDGSPKVVKWKGQTLNFSNYTGAGGADYVLAYNSGITADKEVKDDATYQTLKNDPDWWTAWDKYSRYNHDSAVETINSLPDTSAYLATAGGTNTIKFKGDAGSATDGGAINTLTEEEIAVATAKGWTVTLV